MPEPELFLLFVRPLNRAGIRYVVSGSVAAIFYGEPRLTHDVDFVVFLNANDIQRLIEVFPSKEFYLPPKETMLAEMAREHHGHFNLIHLDTGFKADLYPTGRDELNAWAFRGKRSVEFEGENVTLAPPEYVILRKLEYYREGHAEKHLHDIRAMLAVSGEQLDSVALNEWIQRRGLETEWRQVTP
ncbi:MAG TPA: nucleotidyl transferase AbiEii/AbiGii toxin family protein [Verrucomicrobiae bacterium]|nr:nucleotidyl transferase AbiEii/AbiGii toxin family protein [Verrucomicrobiae bacterium]